MSSIEELQAMARASDRAELDAIRHMLADLPDPVRYAEMLETAYPIAAQALRGAYLGNQQPYAGVWRIRSGPWDASMRMLGLTGYIAPDAGLAVGAFGNQVRKALLGEARCHGFR